MKKHFWFRAVTLALLAVFLFVSTARADTVTTTIPVGHSPDAVAVNLVTNKTYVANYYGNSVTVIDGATNSTTTVGVGTNPWGVAVNPVTNKIYVTNYRSNSVTVIDGATNGTTTIGTGSYPAALAVNPVTNKIYVASGPNQVTVIDGATNITMTVSAGLSPRAVAVNPVTDKIYVANEESKDVTVIDGASNTTSDVVVGTQPIAVAVNPATNKIYVANYYSNSVTVIDGATNSTKAVTAGLGPDAVVVNPVTNKIYVADETSNNVTVIDGATNATSGVVAGSYPYALAVNPVTNRIYVANYDGNNVTVIDGATNSPSTIPGGTSPNAVAVNPVTDKIYIANWGSDNVTVIDGAGNSSLTFAVGAFPISAAVNPVTNKIYVANLWSNNVTVIDGATNSTSTVNTARGSQAVAVNPVTNKIYVANENDNNVTVIDGASNLTTNVNVGNFPQAVTVDPVTNQIYVANGYDGSVTVIDGVSNSTTTVDVGWNPIAVAVNPVTNKIYVANELTNNVTVIDGATHSTATVDVGARPLSLAVNPVTNQIYVANCDSACGGSGTGSVTVIDGATNNTTTINAGTNPHSVAVNPITNKIYVGNYGSSNVTVIDGATNSTTTVGAGSGPYAVAVNPVSNKIYVANNLSGNVTVIDGATNSTTMVSAGATPDAVVVNPLTNQVYIPSSNSNNLTVITEQNVQPIPLSTSISTLPNQTAFTSTPIFTFTPTNSYTPRSVYFQIDTWQNAWTAATTSNNVTWTGTTPPLQLGMHVIYAWAGDGSEATSINRLQRPNIAPKSPSSPLIGSISAYLFVVAGSGSSTPNLLLTKSAPAFGDVGSPLTYTLVVTNNGTASANNVIVTDTLPASVTLINASNGCSGSSVIICTVGALAVNNSNVATIAVSPLTAGVITNQAQATSNEVIMPTTASVTTTILNRIPTTITLTSAPNPSLLASAVTFTATVTPTAATGLVTFRDNGIIIGQWLLSNGGASFSTSSLTFGAHSVTAEYSGDTNYGPSTSSVLTQTVNIPATGHRDFGNVRVWALNFVDHLDGSTTAYGSVFVGPATLGDNGKYFSVGTQVDGISGTNVITLTGQLAYLQGGQPLIAGIYTATDGVLALNNVTDLVTTLGNSQIGITPSLSISLTNPEVDAQAQVNLTLPNSQTLNSNFAFKIGPNHLITPTSSVDLNLNFADGTLHGTFSAGSQGVEIKNATLNLPDILTFNVDDLVIDGVAPAKMHFKGNASVPLPDLNLRNGFFQLKGITATLGLDNVSTPALAWRLDLKVNSMVMPSLPFTSSVTVGGPIDFYLSSANVGLNVPDFKLTVFGDRNFAFQNLQFQKKLALVHSPISPAAPNGVIYQLVAGSTQLDVPKSWMPPGLSSKFVLTNVAIIDQAPFIQVGAIGTKFSLNQPYYLAGNSNSDAAIMFDQLSGQIVYQNQLQMLLDGRVSFKFLKDITTTASAHLFFNSSGISATLTSVGFNIAGLGLSAQKLDYANDFFSAGSVSLQLPQSWGSGSFTVNNLRIDSNGLTLGGGSGTFPIPDQTFGIFSLTNNQATITTTVTQGAGFHYVIQITTTATISKVLNAQTGASSVSASGSVRIDQGRVSGSINGFGFKLAGLEFDLQQPTVTDDQLTVQRVNLQLPASLGNAGTTIQGLSIGRNGFSIAGGRFRLPDFTFAKIGVQNISAEFIHLPDGTYSIGASAKLGFESFAVDGGFKFLYIPTPPELRLQQVAIAFDGSIVRGTAIPIGDTGLFLTHVGGSFDLTSGTLQMTFDVRAAMGADFFGIPWISADGSIAVRVHPFDLLTSANTRLLGITVDQVVIHITPRAFSLTGTTEWQIARSTLSLAFGLDGDHEFTAYGQAVMEIGLRKGSIGCIWWACLPPFDLTIDRRGFDAGKFTHNNQKVWGARGYYSFANWVTIYLFVRVSPSLGLDVGTNLNAYQPVPIGMAERPIDGVDAVNAAYQVNVNSAANQLIVVEAITNTNRPNPQPIAITAPNGAIFTRTIVYTSTNEDERIYAIDIANPAQAVGAWTLTVQPGNAIGLWGAAPLPQINTFDVVTPQGALLPIEQQATPRFTFSNGVPLTIRWNVSATQPSFKLHIFAEDAAGMRHTIITQTATSQTQLSGNAVWTPYLASGIYTLTLSVDDNLHSPAYARKEPIVISDTTPPAAPTNLIAAPQTDGSVLLTWNGNAAEPDVAGYRVSVDGSDPQVQTGRLSQYAIFGLPYGTTHQFAVSAYDFSGNVGPAATAQATLLSNGLSANWPGLNAKTRGVNQVWFTFVQPITLTGFTLINDQGVVISGTTTPITFSLSPDEELNLGARLTTNVGSLPIGVYTVTASVLDAATSAPINANWSFTILPPLQMYLPLIRR